MSILQSLEKKKIVLVGAGQLGRLAVDMWPTSVPRPHLILDSNRVGKLEGIAIEKLEDHRVSHDNAYVLSFFKESASSVRVLYDSIFKQPIVTVYDVLTETDPDQFSNGWSGNPEHFGAALEGVRYFSDSESRAVFRAAAEWRYRRVLLPAYPLVPESSKYRIKKYLMGPVEFELVIDGGSYDFSFARELNDEGFAWKRLVAFEPDAARFVVVTKEAAPWAAGEKTSGTTEVDGRALWSSCVTVPFYQNGLLSARIAKSATRTVDTVSTTSLSSVFDDFSVDKKNKSLVKLHIEGAEWPVIEASGALLSGDTGVSFLVNLSHDEDSFLRIPKIFGETKRYRLYLQSHSLFGEGLTLFATPYRN